MSKYTDDDDLDELLNCYSSASTKKSFQRTVNILKSSKTPAPSSAKRPDVSHEVPPNPITNNKPVASAPVVPKSSPLSDDSLVTKAPAEVGETDFSVKTASKASARISPLSNKTNDDVPDKLLDNSPVHSAPADSVIPAEGSRNEVVDLCTVTVAKDKPNEVIFLCDEGHDRALVEAEVPARRYNTRRSTKSIPAPIAARPTKKVTKKRGRKGQAKATDDEVMFVETVDNDEKNRSIQDDDCNYDVNVKILWKSVNVVKIPVRRMQKLTVVFEHLMKLEKVPLEQVMLTFKNQAVKPTDTPDSLNLNVWDFLEGGVLNSPVESCLDSPKAHKSAFSIKFQDVHKKSIVLPARANEKMKIVMTRYAEQVDKPLESIKFMFDGSVVNHSDTPDSLDLDCGDVIDVIYLN